MNKETKNEKYTEVWGDTVVLKELFLYYWCFFNNGYVFLRSKNIS